jgi:hypothetical protein
LPKFSVIVAELRQALLAAFGSNNQLFGYRDVNAR